jgi:outer membrane protein assembly factor BamD (BamD/ComL family)
LQEQPSYAIFISIAHSLVSHNNKKYETALRPPHLSRTTPMLASDQIEAPPEASRKPEYLTLPELERARDYYLVIDDKDTAAKYVEEMIRKSNDPKQLKELRLQLADLYFETGRMEAAGKLYAMYLTLYPGDEYRAYAHYQAILCRFYMSLNADKDQSGTTEALILAQEYINRAQHDTTNYAFYLKDVEDLRTQCSKKLYESDMSIFNFYLNKGSYNACKVHLANMKTRFVPLLAYCEQELLGLEYLIAGKLDDKEMIVAIQEEVRTKYPCEADVILAHQTQQQQNQSMWDAVKLF